MPASPKKAPSTDKKAAPKKRPAAKTAPPSSEPAPAPKVPDTTAPELQAAPGPVAENKPAPASIPPPAPVPPEAAAPSAAPDDSKLLRMKPPIVVKELAEKMGLRPFQVVHELMEMSIFATLNQTIDEETARKVCEHKGFIFELEKRKEGQGVHKEVEVIQVPIAPPIQQTVEENENLRYRPPVVTIMGHVDHGKTSLLDHIRRARVAAGEAGGITQHIGAYTVERDGKTITFLDTPGHAAFTAMRARGASVTDIVVLVVAADDGLMPQTLEAIQHAKAAKVAILVAINKMDLPGANPDRVLAQLQEQGLAAVEWGGDIEVCKVSATKGTGVDTLLETIQLQAEMLELKADPTVPAHGVVIESRIEPGSGPNATVIIQHGTLRAGDPFICGLEWGKIKALVDDRGQRVKEAGPSMPVKILGFSGTPQPGEELTVMKNERQARQLSEERQQEKRLENLTSDRPATLEGIFDSLTEGQKKVLNIILKGDVQGSVEAIVDSLRKIPSTKVDLNILMATVGPISENDVLLAKASNAVVIGFGTKTDNAAANAAKRETVQIKLYSIIYELLDQIREAMQGLLEPETREKKIGHALVKKVFSLSKFPVAGCIVETGRISKSARARVLRKNQPVYDGGIVTLKHFQNDVNEIRSGMECGIRLGKYDDYEEGDVIECYELEKIPQSLE